MPTVKRHKHRRAPVERRAEIQPRKGIVIKDGSKWREYSLHPTKGYRSFSQR